MTELKLFLLAVLCSVLGAMAHERDIADQCRKQGKTGYSGWTISLVCKVE